MKWNSAWVLAAAAMLSACDTVIENSKFNTPETQVERIQTLSIVNEREFKFDPMQFVAVQLEVLEKKLVNAKVPSNPKFSEASSICGSTAAFSSATKLESKTSSETLQGALSLVVGEQLASDRAIRIAVATGMMNGAISLESQRNTIEKDTRRCLQSCDT